MTQTTSTYASVSFIDQIRVIANIKTIIELDVAGFGIVSVGENVGCDHCQQKGGRD